MILRPYQNNAVEAVISAQDQGLQRMLYVLPTGCGKTQVMVGIWQQLACKTLILAHREELLDQAAMRFLSVDARCAPAVEQGSRKAHRWAEVIAASVQTLARGERLNWFKPGLIIVDEAHHVPSPTYQKVLERFGCFKDGGPLLVGCTATPERLDKKSLGRSFQEQVFTMTPGEAVEGGWWSDILAYSVKTDTDLSNVGTTAGDFNAGKLAVAVDVAERTREIIRHWREVAADRTTVAFCVNKGHARHFCEAFLAEGITAEVLTEDEKRDRAAILKRFKSDATQVLCNVEVATEGFDHPGISCVVTARPTQSASLFTQMVGRGTRTLPGVLDGLGHATNEARRAAIAASAKPNCIVIDAADNAGRHNIATVPTILGLPRRLDLQGRSLGEAARTVKQIEERGETLADQQAALVFADLETRLEQVDLLSVPTLPQEARDAQCRLAWRKTADNAFYVNCGKGRDAALTLSDSWTLTYRFRGQSGKKVYHPEHTASVILSASDRHLLRIWPDALKFADASATGPLLPPTDAQVSLLRRFEVPAETISRMDRTEASVLIGRHKARAERSLVSA